MESNITKIKKNNIADEVFEQLKKNIILKKYPANSKIPSENELASLFGVSRVSIRAAIQKLTALGFLEARRGEGTFVKESNALNIFKVLIPNLILNTQDQLEILEFRRGIEIEAGKLAAEKASKENIESMKKYCRLMEKAKKENNFKEYGINDYKFHLEIIKASRNSVFIEIMNQLKDVFFYHLSELAVYGIKKDAKFNPGYKFHYSLIEAIENNDKEKIPYYYEIMIKANEDMILK